MRSILVTGAGGFVGRHLVAHLLEQGDGPLVGLAKPDAVPSDLPGQVRVLEVDLTDQAAVRRAVQETKPAFVYHLAAQASVADSHADPLGTLFNNIGSQLNLLQALVEASDQPRVLVVGSNEEYGLVQPDELPVRETNELRPLSPYAVSKVAQDLLGFQFFKTHGLPIVRARPFGHTGPGQEPRYVMPAFARQVARIEAGLQAPVLSVGDLSVCRDYSDARDIVRAYRLLLHQGEPGEVYNVGSERAISIQSILDGLLALSEVKVRVEVDPARLRPSEAPTQYCDCSKLRARTGWRPLIPFEQTVAEVLADWRGLVARLGDKA